MADQAFTVRDALRTGAERLALRDDLQENAKWDAQQLLEIATGLSRVQMLARLEALVGADELAQFDGLLRKRLQAVPIQYLRGTQEFYGRDFLVTPDVLIPRPETEDIIAAVLERVTDKSLPVTIVDVGTGSGAIAITLALELPNSHVTAIDISAAALHVAQQNASLLAKKHDPSLADRIRFVQSDLLIGLEDGEQFNFIVSNPPYIPLHESNSLHPQVHDHEPHLALFGGEDGNDILRRLISEAWHRLVAGGFLVMETSGSNDALYRMLEKWPDITSRTDFRGMERVIVAARP